MDLKMLGKTAVGFLQKNSPYILTGLGCVGVITTAVMTGRATVKAIDIIREYEDKNGEAHRDNPHVWMKYETTWQEKVKLCWKPYISPCLMGAVSVACIIGAQSVSTKRHAALAAVYSMTENTLKEYQKKVVETIGENKEQKIRDEVATDILEKHPVSKDEIIYTERGKMLCFDSMSGRYFMHDIEKIRRVVNDLNHDLMGVMWVPLNDFYYALGLPGIKLGDELGWTVDELIDVHFSSKLNDDGEPCLVVDYDLTPRFLKGNMWGGM